jgi:hypothetical protein
MESLSTSARNTSCHVQTPTDKSISRHRGDDFVMTKKSDLGDENHPGNHECAKLFKENQDGAHKVREVVVVPDHDVVLLVRCIGQLHFPTKFCRQRNAPIRVLRDIRPTDLGLVKEIS